MAKTHRLTFDDLCKEAFGSGLQPWEFYEYTIDEYLLRREGLKEKRKSELRELYTHVQMQAYYAIAPYLSPSDKRKPISEIIPNIYEEKPAEAKADAKARYKELIKRYQAAGLLNGSQQN